ncbi:MAG: hypothetical protein KFW09_03595 [Oscillospiraceae bacterium]|nr:hypothetical protein [Oscillospiraceae bacterium]
MKKIIISMFIILQIFISPLLQTVHALTPQKNATSKISEAPKNIDIISPESWEYEEQGLLGYYYKGWDLQELSHIDPNVSGELFFDTNNLKKIKGAKFTGNIKPSITAKYKISASKNNNVVIKLDGVIILNKSSGIEEIEVNLEKDKLYKIDIEYKKPILSVSKLDLYWSINDDNYQIIPLENLRTPELQTNDDEKLLQNFSLDNSYTIKDSDKDGIPDDWEINGYTIKNKKLVLWNDKYSSKGYKKYLSNPFEKKTISDPYTDLQKVLGQMPRSTSVEARDPLVAASPSITVGIEQISFSKNENVSEGTDGTKSVLTAKSNAASHGVTVGTSGGIDSQGLNFSVSAQYSYSNTSTLSTSDTTSDSWSKQIGINTNQAAFIDANLRYYNTGTAPIYEVTPTTNFILRNSKKTLHTLVADPAQIGNSLAPLETYPNIKHSAISWKGLGLNRVTMSSDDLDKVQTNEELLDVETVQVQGQYGVIDEHTGNLVINKSQNWAPIQTDINAVSGTIILETDKQTLERKVAAPDRSNPEDRTPILTIGEAIKKAFNATDIDGHLYYTDPISKDKYNIGENTLSIIVDKNTGNELKLQQEKTKYIYDMIFTRDMSLTLYSPTVYDNMNSDNKWDNITYEEDESKKDEYAILKNHQTSHRIEPLKLENGTSYSLTGWVKSSNENDSTISISLKNGKQNTIGIEKEFKFNGQNWAKFMIGFFTDIDPESFKDISIENKGDNDIFFDNIALTNWGKRPDPSKKHILDYMDRPTFGYIDGVTFRNISHNDVFYSLDVNGKTLGVIPGKPVSDDDKRHIDFKEFNGGKGVFAGDKIDLYVQNTKTGSNRSKVFTYGHVDQGILNELIPIRYSYLNDPYTEQPLLRAILSNHILMDNKYTLINLTTNKQYPMHPEGGSPTGDGQYIKVYHSIEPNHEYTILAEYNNIEYYVFKGNGKDFIGIQKDGLYTISINENGKKRSIDGKHNPILFNSKNYSSLQQFYFIYDRRKNAYKIIQKFTNDTLIMLSSSGNTIKLDAVNISYDDQYWIPEKRSDGKYNIRNYYNTNMLLTVHSNKTNLTSSMFNPDLDQSFELNQIIIDNIPPIDYKISMINNPLKSATPVGKDLNLFLTTNIEYEKNQQFKFEYLKSKNAYQIIHIPTNNAVTWLSSSGLNVKLYKNLINSDQLWIPEKIGKNTYIFASLNNPDYVLNIDSDNINMAVQKRNNTNNQKFVINSVATKINQGEYKIHSSYDSSKVVSSNNPSSNNVILEDENKLDSKQKFVIQYIEEKGAYIIINKDSSLSLTSQAEYGNNVILNKIDKNFDNQLWKFEYLKHNTYTISSLDNPNYVLNIGYNNPNINISIRNNTPNQEFVLEHYTSNALNGNYEIQSKSNPKKILSNINTNIELKDKIEGSENPKFIFKYIELKNAYQILDINTGLALCWPSSSGSFNVIAYTADSNYDDQLWNLERIDLSKNIYTISSRKNTNYVLNIDTNGSNIIVTTKNDTDNQKFILEYIDKNLEEKNYYINLASNPSKFISSNFDSKIIELDDRMEEPNNQKFVIKYVASKNAYQILDFNHQDMAVIWHSKLAHNVILYKANINYDDQLWKFEKIRGNIYTISNLYNPDLVLNIGVNGKSINVAKRNSSINQEFSLEYETSNIIDGDYEIASSYNESKVLHNNNTNIELTDSVPGSRNNQFTIKYIESKKAYQILDKNTGLALCWPSNSGEFNVIAYDANTDYDDQLWKFELLENTEDTYIIYNLYNWSYFLNIDSDGKNINLSKRNNSYRQKFKIKKYHSIK